MVCRVPRLLTFVVKPRRPALTLVTPRFPTFTRTPGAILRLFL